MTIAAITENHSEKNLPALFPGAEVRRMTAIPEQADPGIAAYVDLDFTPEPSRIEKLSALLPALVFVNAITPTLQEIGHPFIRINAWPGFATRQLHELVIPGNSPEGTVDAAPAQETSAHIAPGHQTAANTAPTPQTSAQTVPTHDTKTQTVPTPDTGVQTVTTHHTAADTSLTHETSAQAMPTPETTTGDRVKALYRQLDCRYLAAPDVAGMISARVVAGIINEAWYTWEEKVSTKEEIDTAMRLGTNYPMGPFEWGERIGLGEVAALLVALSKTDPRYTPARSLSEAARPCAHGADKLKCD